MDTGFPKERGKEAPAGAASRDSKRERDGVDGRSQNRARHFKDMRDRGTASVQYCSVEQKIRRAATSACPNVLPMRHPIRPIRHPSDLRRERA
jgi:hypothetical protein